MGPFLKPKPNWLSIVGGESICNMSEMSHVVYFYKLDKQFQVWNVGWDWGTHFCQFHFLRCYMLRLMAAFVFHIFLIKLFMFYFLAVVHFEESDDDDQWPPFLLCENLAATAVGDSGLDKTFDCRFVLFALGGIKHSTLESRFSFCAFHILVFFLNCLEK